MHWRKAEKLRLLRQRIKPELFLAFRPFDRDMQARAYFGSRANVVKMAVRQQNFFQREFARGDFGQQALDFAARIDQRGAPVGIPHQRTVLLIRCNRDDGKFHDFSISPYAMPAPDTLLLLSTHCPHCPAMLAVLSEMVKVGQIGRLDVVNLDLRPEIAQTLGVRSVPWLRIGRIELVGAHSKAELVDWAGKADSESGLADYFHLLLKEGQLPRVQAMIDAEPGLLAAVLPIVGNVEASLNVRLGADVLLEHFTRSEALRTLLPRLGDLSQHVDARVRADACHYLGLTGDPAARPWLQKRRDDDDADVREITSDSLAALPPA